MSLATAAPSASATASLSLVPPPPPGYRVSPHWVIPKRRPPYILDKILAALSALGASAEDVVRTRIYIVDEADVLGISRAHGRVFVAIKPANILVVVAKLIGN